MNCQEYWDSYPELAQSQELQGHAAECEACARQLGEHRGLAADLKSAGAEWRRTEAPDRVQRGLVAAYRSQQAFQKKGDRFPWLPVLTWASAAAVLIVLAMIAIRGSEPVAPPRSPARGVELASAAPVLDADADEDASSSDFIPLPNAEQVGDNEDVNVVRVEVPRSAMLAVGLTVNPDRVSEMVEADVMMGPDGVARAVRFVNE